MRRVGQRLGAGAVDGDKFGRHAIAERNRSGLIQKQSIDIARGLDRAAAHREDVLSQQAVDAGDADGGKQSANSRRDQTHEQRDNHGYGNVVMPGVERHRHQGHAGKQENQRESGQQDIERDFVRVFCRSAPSTRAIIRSRKDSPGLAVMRTTMRSDNTFVPPVTAERSPPLSRMTGADSPVMADSSTDAMPSITSPSPGMTSPASTTTVSPLRSADAGTFSSRLPLTNRRAVVSWRILRKVAA